MVSIAVFLIILFFGMIVLSTSCKKSEKIAGPKEKVTIGVASLFLSSPLIIAQEKGYFADEGLDVTFKLYPSGKKALEAMFAGEAEIATVAETPIVFNSFIRDDFSVFATFTYSYDDCKVIGRKDRGVAKPADLKGKKVGIAAKTSSHFFSYIYLNEYGIDPSLVQLIDFRPQDLTEALESGKVDAIVIFEPYAYRAIKALPGKAARLPKSILFKETFNLAAKKSFIKEHHLTAVKILKALDRAVLFIRQNKKESIAVMNKSIQLEEYLLNLAWDDFVFELSMDNALLATVEDEARWAIKYKLTDKTKVPNYLDLFYLDAMRAVRPEAVTIIK